MAHGDTYRFRFAGPHGLGGVCEARDGFQLYQHLLAFELETRKHEGLEEARFQLHVRSRVGRPGWFLMHLGDFAFTWSYSKLKRLCEECYAAAVVIADQPLTRQEILDHASEPFDCPHAE